MHVQPPPSPLRNYSSLDRQSVDSEFDTLTYNGEGKLKASLKRLYNDPRGKVNIGRVTPFEKNRLHNIVMDLDRDEENSTER